MDLYALFLSNHTFWLNSLIYLIGICEFCYERTKLSLRRGEGGRAITHFRVQLPGSVDPSWNLDKAYGRWGWTLAWGCSSLLSAQQKNVANDKRIRTMYQCRVWSLMILWSVLALFSWCVDRVWWVWWGLLGFGWFLTGDGLLIVWCLHALGYCMYCTYHYLLNFV